MNAIWDAKRKKLEAPRQTVAATGPAKKSRKAPAAARFACVLRGQEIGILDCRCSGKPKLFDCKQHGQCIIAATKSFVDGRAMYTVKDGKRSEEEFIPWWREEDKPDSISRNPISRIKRMAVCELCDARQPPETAPESTPAAEPTKPADPFPLASDATAAARVVICRACDKRELCGKPESAARWALEACPDGRWRTES